MSFYFGDTIHEFVSIKVKERHDSIFDQIPRVFICKLFILSAMIMSITWFNDEARCIPPKGPNAIPAYFIHRACWLKGVYVYPSLHEKVDYVAYYGIPTELDKDGTTEGKSDHLCRTDSHQEGCKPMQKEYFHQYKYIPFYVAFLAFIFFYPYMIFKITNTDMMQLRANIKNNEISAEEIVDAFFDNNDSLKVRRNNFRILANYIIKLLYFFNGIIGFAIIDHLTHNRFKTLGDEWITYSKNMKFDQDESMLATPANKFLPVFGICDLTDLRYDLIQSSSNKVRVVCEISTQILYQYTFILYWFVLIFSVCCSAVGIIIHLGRHLTMLFGRTKQGPGHLYNQYMTLRQVEYLSVIQQRHLPMYNTIKKMLNEKALQDVWRANAGAPVDTESKFSMSKFHSIPMEDL